MKNNSIDIISSKIFVLLILSQLIFFISSCRMQMEENKDDQSSGNSNIMLSEAQVQLANIQVAEVKEGKIGRNLALTGELKINEQKAVTISSRVPGRIEKLYFKTSGESVRKGDKLYEFYSDDIVDLQREYLTLQRNNWNVSGRYEQSLTLEDRLKFVGLLPTQINQLIADGNILFVVTIFSPASGKIKSVNVSEGQYVNPGQSLYELAEDDNLWVEAQVFPDEIRFLKVGTPATVLVPAAGNLPVETRISFINPSFESGKNITLVRAVIDNPGNRLYPGMFATIKIQTDIKNGIVIPASSVIRSADADIVWIREEDGGFSGRKVVAGLQSGDSIQIISGLAPSEMVVTSGAYLLNSEYILKEGAGSSFSSGSSHQDMHEEQNTPVDIQTKKY